MSHYLDKWAKADPNRAADLAENDRRMAHGITRTGPAKVSGAHLSDAANEPSEAEAIAADLAYMARRELRFRQTLAVVHEQELAAFRRAGWL